MIRRIRSRLRPGDAGLTLEELLISTMLGMLILVTASVLMFSVFKGSAVQANSDLNSRTASTAMNTMSRYLHAATTLPTSAGSSPAFVTMNPTDTQFYAYVNLQNTAQQPVLVRFFVNSATSHLTQWTFASTCSATTGLCTFPTSTTTCSSTNSCTSIDLGGPIASPTSDGTPLFAYYNAGGATTTDPTAVQSVQVNLELGSTTAGTAGDTHLSNLIALLNVGQFGGSD